MTLSELEAFGRERGAKFAHDSWAAEYNRRWLDDLESGRVQVGPQAEAIAYCRGFLAGIEAREFCGNCGDQVVGHHGPCPPEGDAG